MEKDNYLLEDGSDIYNNINDNEDDDLNQEEIEEMIFDMSSDDFLENEIEEQLTDDIFNDKKRNYIELYMEKYKYLKEIYNENLDEKSQDLLDDLIDNKDKFINSLIEKISNKFKLNIDDNCEKRTKIAKTLYNFFVINYTENIKNFFINYIDKNKKSIINEIKKQRTKSRDVSTLVAKSKYSNSNEALLINNMSFVLFDLIPSLELDSDFINYVLDYDDDITNLNMQKFIDDNNIVLTDDTFKKFIKPFIKKHDGYSFTFSEIVVEFSQSLKQNDIDIFK